MSNDTIISVLFICYTFICLGVGALAGSLRRDTEWRKFLADQRSADDNHWDTTIRDPELKSLWND